MHSKHDFKDEIKDKEKLNNHIFLGTSKCLSIIQILFNDFRIYYNN